MARTDYLENGKVKAAMIGKIVIKRSKLIIDNTQLEHFEEDFSEFEEVMEFALAA